MFSCHGHPMRRPEPPQGNDRDRFRGCLLGGAVGDALGAPVEFLSLEQIRERFGPGGIRDYAPAYGRVGAITDDTQMTLFTAEGLLRAIVRMKDRGIGGAHVAMVKDAYMRWLETQACPLPQAWRDRRDPQRAGWLLGRRELHSRRAPGGTCLSALMHTPYEELAATNGSKGCGGVMRVAPAAIFAMVTGPDEPEERYRAAFRLGIELAAITHGHPTGQLAAGAFAAFTLAGLQGDPLWKATDFALGALDEYGARDETHSAIIRAVDLAMHEVRPEEALPRLGEGWVAEEALAIALYCALVARDFEGGVAMAVNIQGDSDSTGAMTGNLLGAIHGEAAIPRRWLEPLELREVITEVADDFLLLPKARIGDCGDAAERQYWWDRYPGF